MTEYYKILRIEDTLSNLSLGQIGVEANPDPVLGVPAWGGKDYAGNVSKWAHLDRDARFSDLQLIGSSTTGELGILKHDASGVVTGGQMTLEEFNDYISDETVGPAYWDRDVSGYLFPVTDTDTIIVGDGSVSAPGVAYKNGTNTGHYYDNSLSRLRLAMGGSPSWQYELTGDVHRIIVGDDQTAPNQRYFHIKWEEDDYETRSVARIENYRGSGAPGADGTFTISNNIQDGTFGTMTLTNFHPGNSTTYISATGSGATKVDLSATGATAEIKNTADKITFYGQAQADPADSAAAPDYSFVGYTGAGMRYNTSDNTLRFGIGGTDLMGISTAAGVSFELKPLADMKYFSIIHDLSTGSDEPFITIKAAGSGTADGAHVAIVADGSTNADTDTIAEFYSDGGAAYTVISSHAHGLTRNSETMVKSTSDDDSSATKLYARSDSSDSGDAAAISIYNENRGAGNSYIYIYGDSHFGTGQSYIYLGFSGTYWTDVVYFGDDNRTGASPAWTSPGVPLSTNTAAWDNYKTRYGEVGLMDAIYAAGSIGGGVTLDGAYDYGGAGAGRTVNVDNGSVRLLGGGSYTGIIAQFENTNSANTSEVIQIYNNASLSTGKEIFFGGNNGGTSSNYDVWGHQIWTEGSLTIGHGTGSGDTVRRSYTSYQYNNEGATDWSKALMMAEADTSYSQYAFFEAKAGLYGAVSAIARIESSDRIYIEAENALDISSNTGIIYIESGTSANLNITAGDEINFDDGNRSGSTWSSSGIPLSNGTAQWNNMEQLMSGEYSLFYAIRSATNDYRDSGESEGESTTTSTTFQQKLRVTTPSLTSGKGYYILWQCEIGADADNDVYARVQLDDSTTIAEPYFDNNPDAARYRSVSGFYYSDSLSGTVDIDIDYRRAFGSGTVRIRRARILVLRANIQALV